MKTFKIAAILTIIFETLTIALRYLGDLQISRDTGGTIGVLTFGLRIHHSYLGLATIILYYIFLKTKPGWYQYILPFGYALLFSDLIHHFLVLWPIEGDPQFHFVYPNPK